MNNLGTEKREPSRRPRRPRRAGRRLTGLEIWNGFAHGLDVAAHAVSRFCRAAAAGLVRAAHVVAALSVHGLAIVRGLVPTTRMLCLALAFVLALGAALSAGPLARLFRTRTVGLVEDGLAAQIRTQSHTVADVLTEYDIALGEGDVVYPALSTELDAGSEILIRRALEVNVSADGQTHTVSLLNGTVGKALYLAGVTIDPDDIVTPALTETVSSGMDITVSRVTVTEEVEEQRIPYHITYQDSSDLYIGEEEMVRQGTEGVKEVTYRVVSIDGQETERTVVSEEVVEPAYNRIIAQGTQPTPTPKPTATPKPAKTPDPDETKTDAVTDSTITVNGKSYTYSRTLTVMITAYTHTGRKTSTGVWPEVGTVAVDPDVIPYGTRLYIPGYGFGVAQDTGVSGNHIDVFFDTEAECISYGRKRDRTIYILE
ncbi:MAG: G5 domain-containing protein [Candidatus Spyradocola sp.]|jgi:uncharacterized protein YabE (DUF348 family)/3D (Asp-Asp-Asp) domain-containing protein